MLNFYQFLEKVLFNYQNNPTMKLTYNEVSSPPGEMAFKPEGGIANPEFYYFRIMYLPIDS